MSLNDSLKQKNIDMDKRKFNGGRRLNSGRKPKADEMKLIENLNKYVDEEVVFKKLMELIEKGNLKAVQVYLNYKYGKPTEYKVTDMQISPLEDISPMILFKSTEQIEKENNLKISNDEQKNKNH